MSAGSFIRRYKQSSRHVGRTVTRTRPPSSGTDQTLTVQRPPACSGAHFDTADCVDTGPPLQARNHPPTMRIGLQPDCRRLHTELRENPSESALTAARGGTTPRLTASSLLGVKSTVRPAARAPQNTDKQVRFTVFVSRQKALPSAQTTALPSPSAPTSPPQTRSQEHTTTADLHRNTAEGTARV